MHHCLTIQEIIGIICSHLAPIVPSPVRRLSRQPEMKDLAAVARTCSAFQGPALDFMWRYSTLLNLLRSMPSDLWVVDEVREVSGEIKRYLDSLRPIHIADWDRVVSYARRIQHISSSDEDCNLSKIFSMISACFPLELFPDLRGLQWYHSGPQFQYIRLFLASSITSISFNATCAPALSLLSKLGQDHPMLKDVSIKSGEIKAVSAFSRHSTIPSSPKLRLAVSENGDMTRLFERVSRSSLTDLCLYQGSGPSDVLPGHSLRPFLSFTNLLSISLTLPVEIDLDNATISDLPPVALRSNVFNLLRGSVRVLQISR
ncbi:hypothetical protein B0H11DRAFT_2303642 [Mycena galericulata]|nr:hypothetical protein B0H11DRAFT_2303642 [Mycena galericulata]